LTQLSRRSGIARTPGAGKWASVADALATVWRLKMTTTTTQKKGSLRLVLAIAVALGCSSATLSGVFASFAIQSPVGQAQSA
jgi:hypothetical protein